MKISLLLIREDFYQIFKTSTTRFLRESINADAEVSYEELENSVAYRINPLLNIIYPVTVDKHNLSILVQEFSWHKNILKRWLQKLYCYLAIRFPLERIVSAQKCWISGLGLDLEHIVIIPGNHSIRMIDTKSNKCIVYYKDGFDKSLVIADARARLHGMVKCAPAIYQLNEELGWYEEERITGFPLNRIANITLINNFESKIFETLERLYENTKTQVILNEYISSLNQKVAQFVEAETDKNLANRIIEINTRLMDELKISLDSHIVLATSHGDLQPANILCSEQNFWLIDWEYSAQRTEFYDRLVYITEMRRVEELSGRLNGMLEKISTGTRHHLLPASFNTENGRVYFYVFLLEDLILRLYEISSELIQNKHLIIGNYLIQIEQFINSTDPNDNSSISIP